MLPEWEDVCEIKGVGEYQKVGVKVPFHGKILMSLAIRICERFGRRKQYLEDASRIDCPGSRPAIFLMTPARMWAKPTMYYEHYGFVPCVDSMQQLLSGYSPRVLPEDSKPEPKLRERFCSASKKLRRATLDMLTAENRSCAVYGSAPLPDSASGEVCLPESRSCKGSRVGNCFQSLSGSSRESCMKQVAFLESYLDVRGSAMTGYRDG
eukprot:gnl/TRDRNA2_/TRDRNA2_32550_c0_seq1.p1 gnl/TRDRNA2_/TRDRNA2_32550_c0~~gnl/TRDRNA2_/TRDRNA2_32550_c0_seq1.p1  ORF type:complete len:209 (+),score=24.46 gnl/TRDRNA2_/TRDRNA2_32550_c0_seq1:315-941(+)